MQTSYFDSGTDKQKDDHDKNSVVEGLSRNNSSDGEQVRLLLNFQYAYFAKLYTYLVSFQKTITMNMVSDKAQLKTWNWLSFLKLWIVLVSVYLTIAWLPFILTSLIGNFLMIKSHPGILYSNSVTKLQKGLCMDYYNNTYFLTELEPWSEDTKQTHLKSMYIEQTFHTKGERSNNILDFFNWNQRAPSRYLLTADQGEGKSMSIKYATLTWCETILTNEYQHNQLIKYQRKVLLEDDSIEDKKIEASVVLDWLWKIFPNSIKMKLLDEFLEVQDLKPFPELVLAFEFKDLCTYKLLEDILLILVKDDLTRGEVRKILDGGRDTILFAFDGYDEFTKFQLCQTGVSTEVEAIIKRESRKNYNLLVSSRPWRSEDLLSVERFGFKKLVMIHNDIDNEVRNKFIKNFFVVMDDDLSDGLILALDSERNVIPSELVSIKRMLLYICHIWSYNFLSNTVDSFFSEDEMLNNLWELMRLTYNKKYPEAVMSKEDLKEMRKKIGQLTTETLTFEEMHDVFGDDNKFDIFFFGIYSTSVIKKVGNIGELVKETTVIKETPGLEKLVEEERKKQHIEALNEEMSWMDWISSDGLSIILNCIYWIVPKILMLIGTSVVTLFILDFFKRK